jgi:hypothetical protein
MHKKKQRAALNYPPIKPSGYYPTPSVAEIKGLFPPQVRAQGAYHLCVVEFSAKKRYHLQTDYLFDDDKPHRANLCNSITEVRRLAEASPELSASVAGFLGDHLQPQTFLTASVAQLLK